MSGWKMGLSFPEERQFLASALREKEPSFQSPALLTYPKEFLSKHFVIVTICLNSCQWVLQVHSHALSIKTKAKQQQPQRKSFSLLALVNQIPDLLCGQLCLRPSTSLQMMPRPRELVLFNEFLLQMLLFAQNLFHDTLSPIILKAMIYIMIAAITILISQMRKMNLTKNNIQVHITG